MDFHRRTIELHAENVHASRDAEAELDAFEARSGVRVPQAVREWFALAEASKILLDCSNCDPPLPVADWELRTASESNRQLVVFKRENQGVCKWAFLVDDGDDPRVVVDVDSDGCCWTDCSATFSEYVYSCVWDFKNVLLREPLLLSPSGPWPADALTVLRSRFSPGKVTTGWPGETQYRFFGDDHYVLIWVYDDQADWWIAAESLDGLISAVAKVWGLGGLSSTLYSNESAGEELLASLRKRSGFGLL